MRENGTGNGKTKSPLPPFALVRGPDQVVSTPDQLVEPVVFSLVLKEQKEFAARGARVPSSRPALLVPLTPEHRSGSDTSATLL
jgi:hypothetical protein